MANALPPGIGNPQQAQQATAFIRDQPWYTALLKTWGLQNPPPGVNGGNPVTANGQPAKLSDEQQQQLIASARQAGIGISDRYSIDENGQIAEPDSHMLRNLAIGGALAASLFIPGVTEAIVAGLHTAGGAMLGGLKGVGGALTGAKGVTSAISAGSQAIGAGSKIAGLLGVGEDVTNGLGNSAAQRAQAETNNRFLAARTDQAGPSADAQAFRNAMRAGLVAKMDPNAAPLVIGGHTLPSLANADTTDYAKTMFGDLRDRQAAGKTPTEFGVPDPSQQEINDTNAASTYSKVGAGINAGSKILNLLNLFHTNTDTSGGEGGAAGSGFGGWAPFTTD